MSSTSAVFDVAEVRPEVVAFCGDCHATPEPSQFPRAAWNDEVDRGYNFYYQSGRVDLAIPAKRRIVEYFRQQAAEELIVPSAPALDRRLSFEHTVVSSVAQRSSDTKEIVPEVAHLLWAGDGVWDGDESSRLLVCDMRLGAFAECFLTPSESRIHTWVDVGHPAHAEPIDLDLDGHVDIVVADLGSALPEDHARGRVLWLRRVGPDDSWKVTELATGLGRVADVQPGDFDDDGDIDLVVAEFGWQKTGRLLLLENHGFEEERPHFESRIVDPRHGAIHVPVTDLNGDGRLDFVALISQEHETIEAFVNQGDGTFRSEVLFAANDASFGSSGIELSDLDGDGDTDVIYTNGDMLDSYYLKPSHAVRWIENRGDGKWQSHVLGQMPGAMRAITGDLDGDGDLDVIATAMIPSKAFNRSQDSLTRASLMWFEQREPRQFSEHVLETGRCQHVALEAADFDNDGDLDLAVGDFRAGADSFTTIWWNVTSQPLTTN